MFALSREGFVVNTAHSPSHPEGKIIASTLQSAADGLIFMLLLLLAAFESF
jgi:hypothetical protein